MMEYYDARFFIASYTQMCAYSNVNLSHTRTIHFFKEYRIVLQLVNDYVGTVAPNLDFATEQEISRGVNAIFRVTRHLKQSLLHEEQDEYDEA